MTLDRAASAGATSLRQKSEKATDKKEAVRAVRRQLGFSTGTKMTNAQKIALRLSEVRTRLNEIAGLEGDALTDEIRNEADTLQKEYRDLETRHRAAIVAEGEEEKRAAETFADGDAKDREKRELISKATVGGYLAHAVAGTGVDGIEAEASAALEVRTTGAQGGVAIPFQMFDTPEQTERRVDVTTSTTNLGGSVVQRPILQRLFGRDLMEALGVRIDTVPAGQAQWPLLTAGVAPDQRAESSNTLAPAPDAVAATFSTQSLKPLRLTGKYQYTVEQAAEVKDLEQALRRDLADAVRAKMNDQILNGSGTAGQVTGFYTRLAAPGAPSAIAVFADYAGLAASAVDGSHAIMESEVGCVLGVATYRHAAGVYRGAGGGDESAIEAIKRRSRMCRASSFVPAPSSDVQNGNILHAGMDAMRGDSIAAVWPTLEVIRDIYSGAGDGIVSLTWITLWDAYTAFRADAYTAFRADAYKRVAFQLA